MMLKLAGIGSLFAIAFCSFFSSKPNSPFPSGRVDSIFFENPSHGFIQVLEFPRSVYETGDGGETWKKVENRGMGFRTGRSFANARAGWSIDENLRDHGKIFQTEDGGLSWKAVFDTQKKNDFVFGGIQAISETEAWAVGITGAYHTDDGGKVWKKQGPAGTGLQFLNAEVGWIIGGKLWHTNNGGGDWQALERDGKTCFGGLGVFFLDEKHAWAVGGETEGNAEDGARTGFVTVTEDGGRTCHELPKVPGQILWSVFFLNDHQGWVGGIGSILKTEDGGRTWSSPF